MRIAVCIVTREHPGPLLGVVMGLWRLRSTRHEIQFIFGVDCDDAMTPGAIALMGEIGPHPIVVTAPRSPTRGEAENRVLSHARNCGCDAATLMTDRTFCITPAWDDAIARGVAELPNRPLWWSCPQDNVCAIPIMPQSYLHALDWKWSPELFPFWFDDTWNQQIDLMIYGMPSKKLKASFSGQRGKTTRGRDFGFWIDFFHRTLPIRAEAAKQIADRLGVPFKARPDVLQYFDNWRAAMKGGVATLEAAFGDPRDPGPEYAIAKDGAEKMLAAMTAMDFGAGVTHGV